MTSATSECAAWLGSSASKLESYCLRALESSLGSGGSRLDTMSTELPPDPFSSENIRLWRVLSVDEDTREVYVALTPEGWGWLHTLQCGIESDGTYGTLLVTHREDVTEHDAGPS